MKFKINFELNDKNKLFEYWDDIIKNNVWSHGKYTELFEEKWSKFNDLYYKLYYMFNIRQSS